MDTEDRENFKTIASQSPARQDGSRKPPAVANFPSALGPQDCLNLTKILFACYRKDEAHDPELYCAAVAAIFSEYPAPIAQLVADPRTGLASRLKFLPSVAEVKECCEAEMARAERITRYAALPKVERVYVPPIKREPGTSYVEMFAKHGRPLGRFEAPDDEWNRSGARVMPESPAK